MNIHVKDNAKHASGLSRRSLLKAGAGLAIGVYIAKSAGSSRRHLPRRRPISLRTPS
jgi:isoquinoline 1-oxidoreductase beta subunit